MVTYNDYWILCHSFKGTTWKNHKYIRKEGGRYIYPDRFKSYGTFASESYGVRPENDQNNKSYLWYKKPNGFVLRSEYTNSDHEDFAKNDKVGARTYRFEDYDQIKNRYKKQSSKLYKAKLKISAALGKIKNKLIKNFKSEKYDWDYSGAFYKTTYKPVVKKKALRPTSEYEKYRPKPLYEKNYGKGTTKMVGVVDSLGRVLKPSKRWPR